MNRFILFLLLLLSLFSFPGISDADGQTGRTDGVSFTFAAPEDTHPRITLDEGGSDLLLTAAEPLTDVRVLQLQYIYDEAADREYFEVTSELCASDRWEAGDGVILKSYIPDTIPNLYISYVRADGTAEGRFLSQSGKDGSLLLLELDIPILSD